MPIARDSENVESTLAKYPTPTDATHGPEQRPAQHREVGQRDPEDREREQEPQRPVRLGQVETLLALDEALHRRPDESA